MKPAHSQPKFASGRFGVEQLTAAAFRSRGEAFADLARRSPEPNPHMSPAAIAAATATLVDPEDVTILAVTDRQNDGRLSGAWALARSRPAWALGLPVLTSPLLPLYEVLSHPVLDGEVADATLGLMLEAVLGDPLLPKLIRCPSLPLDGPFARALNGALPDLGGKLSLFELWSRSTIRPDAARDTEAYLRKALRSAFKKRRTQRRALGRTGDVAFAIQRGEEARVAALEFLALEASGWKGAAGTALASNERHTAYARRLVQGFAARDELLVASLTRDGRPIAMGLLLQSSDMLVFLKTAYDEAEARFSPGIQLEIELTRALISDPAIALMDAGIDDTVDCAAHPWTERRAMGHGLIALGNAPVAWAAAHGLALRQKLRATRTALADV